jgi:putative sterol carrier protein
VARYLTPEWFDAAQRAIDHSSALAEAAAAVQVVVQQTVTDGPDGDVAYHVLVDGRAVQIVSGEATDPTVTFIESWATAGAIARGELSAQGAFMSGLIRVRGDLPKLVECGNALGDVDDALADVRAQTTY